MLKIRNLTLSLCLLSGFFLINTGVNAQNISSNISFLKENLNFLASDSLKGRYPGTVEDSVAAYYIANKMEKMGLVPLIGDSYVVPFYLSLNRSAAEGSYIKLNNNHLIKEKDYSISPLSPTVFIKGQVSLDTTGNSVNNKDLIALIHSSKDSINFKITPLIEKGFSAVMFYDSSTFTPYNNLKGSQSAIPVVMISADYAQYLSNNPSAFCEINSITQINLAKTYNVAGITPGNKGKYILAGAHYDHLGIGGKGSGSMSPNLNEVHPGADDNASGVSAILEIGRLFSGDFKIDQNSSQYDIAISAFGAEEKGLIGSAILADSLLKLNNLPTLMINLDMVGRLKDNKLQAGGAGTFNGAESILAQSNKGHGFDLIITKEGMGPSDHSSFYSKKVPVLYFTTGVHKEYHTPADSSSYINFTGLKSVTDYVVSVVNSIKSWSSIPEYSYIEQPASAMETTNFKVTLGVIPDFTYEKGDGFKIGPVSEGRPAHKADMKEGDIITKIGEKKINNIYDYMSSLGDFKKGQKVEIAIIRDGVKSIKVITF